MTLKYESEILYGLMKRDGDDSPSDVLPYESELKEKYLNQVMGAYPKLQDYRPEWLNYNLYKHLPADFPVESVSNVTEASFQNVVPYAFGKAELKGQTLVNLSYQKESVEKPKNSAFQFCETGKVSQGKKYLLIVNFEKINDIGKVKIEARKNDTWLFDLLTSNINLGTTKFIIDIPNDRGEINSLKITNPSQSTTSVIMKEFILLEYQDGMENWDIPYFEGMQSVKMPVLTTTGKNLFDGAVIKSDINVTTGEIIPNEKSVWFVTDYIDVKDINSLCFQSGYMSDLNVVYMCFDTNKNFIGYKGFYNSLTGVINPLENTHYIRLRLCSNIDLSTTQIEQGTQATSYEPFKSNILSTPSDLELRGIGDVTDELDCLTGELTQRIGKYIITGDEPWLVSTSSDGYIACVFNSNGALNRKERGKLRCNKLKTLNELALSDEYCSSGVGIYVSLNQSKATNKTEFINHIKNEFNNGTPYIVYYELATPTVKTVDLTCSNEQGQMVDFMPLEGTMNVQTSSDTIQPLLDMEVPVEAITQNLNSFASMEE